MRAAASIATRRPSPGGTAGRRKLVARGLERLANGESYTDVSLWALDETEIDRSKPRRAATRRGRTPASDVSGDASSHRVARSARERQNSWHIAADWTEAFAPVVFGPVEAKLRTAALAERKRLGEASEAGQPVNAWRSIETRRALLDGRLERRRFRRSGKFDADGNEIPERRHHPPAPVRRPRTRFLRQAAL